MPTPTRWTGHHFCALQDALGLTNERMAEHLRIAVRSVANWRTRGHEELSDMAQRLLPAHLDKMPPAVRERFDALVIDRTGRHAGAVDDVIGAAVSEVDADRLILAAEQGTESVTELWEDARSLARAANRTALETFTAAQAIRRQAYGLAERTKRPATLADLYVVIGQATSLMASTAFDLNRWNDAEALVRSAGTYANLAGDASLEAWTLGLRATLANWRSEPETALRHIRRALNSAPPGTPQVRLRYIASRSFALLEDVTSVEYVLKVVQRDREAATNHHDRLSEETGGEFAFSDARAAACAAAAWLDVRNGEQAETHGQLALSELLSLPRHRQPYSQIAGTQIDIGTARAVAGNVDGAAEMTRPVLALPANRRNVSLAGRLMRLRDAVSAHVQSSETARAYREEIDAWIRDSNAIRAQEFTGTP